MSSYYDSTGKSKFDVKEMGLPVFVQNYLNYLLIEQNKAPRTVYDYAISIRLFLRWIRYAQMRSSGKEIEEIDVSNMQPEEIAGLSTNDIYEFFAFCSGDRENGASSRAAKLAALKSFYRYMKTRDTSRAVRENPAEDISSPKKEQSVPKYLTLEDARRLLDTVLQDGSSRDYCIILWLLTCGMRLSELVGINMKDIHISDEGSTLLIRGKGRKERRLPLNQQCVDALNDYLIERNAFSGADKIQELFLSNRGKRITARRVEQIVEKYILASGLEGNGYSPHKLRHTAATLIYNYAYRDENDPDSTGKADLLELSQYLGHSSVGMTEHYIHTMGVSKKPSDAMGKLLG